MTIGVVRTAWSGTSGGPGVTQLFFHETGGFGPLDAADAQAAVNAMRTYWDAIKALLPDEVVLTVSAVVDQYDPITGDLTHTVTAATPPSTVQGSSAGVYAMASGMRVNLQTAVIRNGRRVRGAQYIVPASSTAFSSSGTVTSGNRATVNTAGTALMAQFATAGLAPIVYSRPIPAGEPNGPRGGDVAQITSWDTSEKGAVLRGRRD